MDVAAVLDPSLISFGNRFLEYVWDKNVTSSLNTAINMILSKFESRGFSISYTPNIAKIKSFFDLDHQTGFPTSASNSKSK